MARGSRWPTTRSAFTPTWSTPSIAFARSGNDWEEWNEEVVRCPAARGQIGWHADLGGLRHDLHSRRHGARRRSPSRDPATTGRNGMKKWFAVLLLAVRSDGTRISVAYDTICIHADMEHAVDRLRAIRQRLGGME